MSELLLKIEKLVRDATYEELEEVRQYINHMADIKSFKIESIDKNGVYHLENGALLYDFNDQHYRED